MEIQKKIDRYEITNKFIVAMFANNNPFIAIIISFLKTSERMPKKNVRKLDFLQLMS